MTNAAVEKSEPELVTANGIVALHIDRHVKLLWQKGVNFYAIFWVMTGF
jgi:hypothetical protein